MILGNGMISKALQEYDREDVIFFCSGVSNSNETSSKEFDREKNMLLNLLPSKKKIIYFSSYFVNFEFYHSRKYYEHKLNIEKIISSKFNKYTIYRLPQVVGNSNNPNTITNFIYNSIKNNLEINLFIDAKRNLIDVDVVTSLVGYANENNMFINEIKNIVAPKSNTIMEIVSTLERISSKKAITITRKSDEFNYPIILSNDVNKIYNELKISFDDNYLYRLLAKYYNKGGYLD